VHRKLSRGGGKAAPVALELRRLSLKLGAHRCCRCLSLTEPANSMLDPLIAERLRARAGTRARLRLRLE
jgi:hypothetical protein